MLFYLRFSLFAVFFGLFSISVNAQHLYYKHLNEEIVRQFKDTSGKIMATQPDSALLQNYAAYVAKFFPNFEYNTIRLQYGKFDQPAMTRPAFKWLFQSSEKRNYKVYISSACPGAMDSVVFWRLDANARAGIMARQMGKLYEYSTSGFFDLLGWYFKQWSGKAKRKMSRENEMKVLEYGLGYQILELSRVEHDKLNIDNWKDANAYEIYMRRERDLHLELRVIQNLISDLPIYVSKNYK